MTDDGTRVSGSDPPSRLPAIIREHVAWFMTRWPGRVVMGSAASMVRIEIFDRAMTIAAQFFTSVFPIMIMVVSWLGLGEFEQMAQYLDIPPETRAVLSEALVDTSVNAFGLVGALVVLVSATSLSRAMTRAFCATWDLARRPSRLLDMWRLLAVVVVVALAMVATRVVVNLVQGLPPRPLWGTAASFAIYALIAVNVPWLLMAGRVPLRCLVPGGIVFALLMLVVRPASSVYLSYALESSAQRYGTIGLAFTYITWLYVISFTMLASAVIGQIVASDGGRLGRFIRRD